MSTLTWTNESEARPGYSVYDCTVGTKLYRVQRMRDGGIWRLFYREAETVPLRTIFTGDTKKSCQDYAAQYEELNG